VLLVLVIAILSGNSIYSQQQIIGRTYTRSYTERFDVSKLYYKGTDRKVKESDFRKMIQENPRLHIEREFDDSGNLVRYLYDPNNQGTNGTVILKALSEKESVPNFKVTTIDGKKIELEDLKGKLVIVRFEMQAGDYHFKKNDIVELDKKINSLKNKENVEAIIIFGCGEEEVRKGFDLPESNFKLVANGQNFIIKYGISRFPSTLLIDQNGKLIGNFLTPDEVVLDEHIKE
jgi:nitrate reductase NapAB chaperone NapD